MAAEWMMKDDHEQIDQDRAELDRLRAELARVRAERDRLFASGFFDHQNEIDPVGDRRERTREESIAEVLQWMKNYELLGSVHALDRSAVAAALAEHDRQFSDPDRPAGSAPASPG